MFVERVNRWCSARSKEQGARSDRAGATTSGRGEVERSRAAREGQGWVGGEFEKVGSRQQRARSSKVGRRRTQGRSAREGHGRDGQEGALAVTTRTRLPVSSVTEESCDSKSGVEEL